MSISFSGQKVHSITQMERIIYISEKKGTLLITIVNQGAFEGPNSISQAKNKRVQLFARLMEMQLAFSSMFKPFNSSEMSFCHLYS